MKEPSSGAPGFEETQRGFHMFPLKMVMEVVCGFEEQSKGFQDRFTLPIASHRDQFAEEVYGLDQE